MPQERTEGTTGFATESTERISADMPVFYNPVMKLNRDLTILMLAAMPTWMRAPVRVALPMEASGIRAARILNECPAKPGRILVNDRNETAIGFARENCERNRHEYPAGALSFTTLDASVFLRTCGGAEYVDIDPFGTPNPFLDAAVQAVTRGGILAVSATDTSALAGTYPRATARKYWSAPSRTWAMHEWGLRILIRKVQLVAAQYDRALTPVLSVATDHYYRVFFRHDGGGVRRIQEILAAHQRVHVDTATLTVTLAADGETGPLWTGPLHDVAVVNALRTAAAALDPAVFTQADRLLALIEQEARVGALGFIDLHELASRLGVHCPKRDLVLERLGADAARTHVNPVGIVTTRPIEQVAAHLRDLAPR